jgi:hypothetical protein
MEAKLTATYVIGVLRIPMMVIGLVGNVLSFLVFSRRKFTDHSISIYCRALAISDSFTLYQLVFDIIYYAFNILLSSQSEFWCKLNFYLIISLSSTSTWILVAFSLDKMVQVLGKTQKYPYIKKKKFQLIVVCSIVVLHALLYSFIPILLELKQVTGFNFTDFPCNLQNINN